MKIKAISASTVVLLCACTSHIFASSPVTVLNENGEHLRVVDSLQLAPGRIAVPARVLDSLGLEVQYVATEKRVYVSSPAPAHHPVKSERRGSIPIGFKSGDHQLYAGYKGYFAERHSYPLAISRVGQLYISVNALAKIFPARFTSQWDKQTGKLVLQRRKQVPYVW